MSAHALDFKNKNKNQIGIYKRIKLKRNWEKSKKGKKRGENLSEKRIRVWGDKGDGRRKKRGFLFWLRLDC